MTHMRDAIRLFFEEIHPLEVAVWIAAAAVFVTIILTLGGCALTAQRVETMDGDRFSQTAISTIGKQEALQDASFETLPNNSGSFLKVGSQSTQDSTQMVAVIQALVAAFASQQLTQGQAPASPAATATRIETIERDLAALRRLFDGLQPLLERMHP